MEPEKRPRSGRVPACARRGLAVALAASLFGVGTATATGFLAYERGETCLECHNQMYGRGGLSERGLQSRAQGYRFARDPALTVPWEGHPLSPGGVNMLTRRYRGLGERLFSMREIGPRQKSCADCHAPGEGIEDAFLAYPKLREDAGVWWTLEQAVNDCLVKRCGTRPLGHGSRTSVALQLFLRDLSAADHDSRALDVGLGEAPEGTPETVLDDGLGGL